MAQDGASGAGLFFVFQLPSRVRHGAGTSEKRYEVRKASLHLPHRDAKENAAGYTVPSGRDLPATTTPNRMQEIHCTMGTHYKHLTKCDMCQPQQKLG